MKLPKAPRGLKPNVFSYSCDWKAHIDARSLKSLTKDATKALGPGFEMYSDFCDGSDSKWLVAGPPGLDRIRNIGEIISLVQCCTIPGSRMSAWDDVCLHEGKLWVRFKLGKVKEAGADGFLGKLWAAIENKWLPGELAYELADIFLNESEEEASLRLQKVVKEKEVRDEDVYA